MTEGQAVDLARQHAMNLFTVSFPHYDSGAFRGHAEGYLEQAVRGAHARILATCGEVTRHDIVLIVEAWAIAADLSSHFEQHQRGR